MNRVTFTGVAAEMRWSYQLAATLGQWTIHADPNGGGTLTATVMSSDAFRISQQSLMFIVPRPNGHHWRWPITTLQIAGRTLTAALGSQE